MFALGYFTERVNLTKVTGNYAWCLSEFTSAFLASREYYFSRLVSASPAPNVNQGQMLPIELQLQDCSW